jgi:uncharacterized FlaG/YvyC family protein
MTDPISSLSPTLAVSGAVTGQVGTASAVAATASTTTDAIGDSSQSVAAPKTGAPDLHELAVTLNQHAQELQTSLHFQVDKITGQMVISVIDTQDNQVLMQVPNPEALAVAQSLEHLKMQLMNKTA